ncbi:MAG TPA: outer membrane beta-barrel protein, partial [Reyranella sp.]|nr:outer membrane beta-barrel protein [Reyranella sp.]
MPAFRTVPRCLTIATLFVMVSALPAHAQEERRRSGFYLGGHVGYIFGNANATLADPTGGASAGGSSPYGSLFGGVQVGYEHFFNSRLMLGVELDASFPDYLD